MTDANRENQQAALPSKEYFTDEQLAAMSNTDISRLLRRSSGDKDFHWQVREAVLNEAARRIEATHSEPPVQQNVASMCEPGPITWSNPLKGLWDKQRFQPDTSPLTHQEIFSAVHHHAAEIVRLTAAVPVQCAEPASREVRMECLYCPARFMTAWELEVHEKEHALKSSPADLVGALQDVVHTDPGPVRAGHAVKSREQLVPAAELVATPEGDRGPARKLGVCVHCGERHAAGPCKDAVIP